MSKITDFIDRAALATGRSFTDAQRTVLAQDLNSFESNLFIKITDEYLRLDQPPKNIIGYFRKRGSEINNANRDAQRYSSLPGDRPTAEQGALYLQIISVATRKYEGDDYIGWCETFGQIWLGYTGEQLLDMMRKTLDMLQKMPDAERGVAMRDRCMADNLFDGKPDSDAHKRRDPYKEDEWSN